MYDVMRGEETELLGCANDGPKYTNLCLPGTHTKWVRMEGPQITAFTTCMTGDLYRAILEDVIQSGVVGNLNCPYQANVIKRLDALSSSNGAIMGQVMGILVV